MSVVIGSRRSKLALWQTNFIASKLQVTVPGFEFQIVEMDTAGDKNIAQPLPEIGGKGLFTAELDQAIRDARIDFAVHSLKDLPTTPESGIEIIPLSEREDPRDVLVARDGLSFNDLPEGSVIGTSSPRRASQVLSLRNDLEIQSIRGNVPTRIGKVESGEFDAVILAAAGVKRVGLDHKITHWFSPDEILPAPGQGCIAATIRVGDARTRELLETIADENVAVCVEAERLLLAEMGGGCSAPIGALATIESGITSVVARVVSSHQRVITESRSDNDSKKAARDLATLIRKQIPLFGKRVVVTRATHQSSETLNRLQKLGAEAISIPMIGIQSLVSSEEASDILDCLPDFDWLVFTSSNAVEHFFNLLGGRELPVKIKVSCVGEKTAQRLKARFREPDFVPSAFDAQTLAKEIPVLGDEKVLFPCPRKTVTDLDKLLGDRKVKVTSWPIYETTACELSANDVDVLTGGVDAIMFASPSAVDSFCSQLEQYQSVLRATAVVCIGRSTQKTAEHHGVQVDLVPDETSIDAMVNALIEWLNN